MSELVVYGATAAGVCAAVADHYGADRYAGPEPHAAEQILTRWLTDAGVTVEFDAALPEMSTAGVYIGASYEGDLLALAGVSYRVGRESRSLHGETFAGRTEPAPGQAPVPAVPEPVRPSTVRCCR